VRVWRICREAQAALDGEGARLFGGRWNSEEVAVVYASATLSLAALEYLAHIDIEDVPADLIALAIDVPDDSTAETIATTDLPPDWRMSGNPACVALGDAWAVRGETLTLSVPSAIVPDESNVLINPAHAHAARVQITASRRFSFDPRLP
jgi:RES domain-containing protein